MWGMSNNMSMACAVCGTAENLQRCGQCRMVVYCGVEHQRAHWPMHSQTCMAYPMSHDMYGSNDASDPATDSVEQTPTQEPENENQENENVENIIKPNQKTLDGRNIFLPENEEEPEKLSMTNLPLRGSSISMEEGSSTRRTRPAVNEDDAPPAKKRRVSRKREVPSEPIAPVLPREPTPPVEEEFILETLWKTTLGMLVLRENKGYYGDGPDFDWKMAKKYLNDVKSKRTKGNKPVTEKWGKWCWDEKVYGPSNFGRFKIRVAANGESFKGTWGWGSRNRGGGTWTGSMVEETRVPIAAPQQEEEIQQEEPVAAAAVAAPVAAAPVPAVEIPNHRDEAQAQDELDVNLCHAAVAGEADKISSLISQGADVNNRLVENCTPIMHAVVMDYPDVVRALLKAPVDLNARDQQGCAPLHICAEHGHVECAKVIIEAADCEAMADGYSSLLSLLHPLRSHPNIMQRIAAFACPVDLYLKNDAGQGVFDLIEAQTDSAPTLADSRRQIASLVSESAAKVAALFAPAAKQLAAIEAPAMKLDNVVPELPSEKHDTAMMAAESAAAVLGLPEPASLGISDTAMMAVEDLPEPSTLGISEA